MSTSPAADRIRRVERRMRHGPVEHGLGVRPVHSGPGELVLQAPLTDGIRDDRGHVAPVLVAMLCDSGIGYLIFAAARLRAGAPTVELRIDHLGPAGDRATALTARLLLLHVDDEVGVGRAELTDDTGRTVAHAVAMMSLTAAPDRPGGLAGEVAGPAGPDAADFRIGLPAFDPARLHPDRLDGDPDGDVAFTPGPTATNLNGTAHGAVLAALARSAQHRHLAGRGDGARTRNETVEYLRPVPLDARIRTRTEPVRSGRRFWSVRTEIVLPDDRVAVRSTAGGTWSSGDGHR